MKLIDKDALLAKIDGEIKLLEPYLGACAGQIVAEANSKNAAYNRVKDIINVLEVKGVDLMMHTIIAEGCDWLALHTKLNHNEIEDCRNLMLTIKDEQLKARKGE